MDDDERRMTDATLEHPIDGMLDLHTFAPGEVKDVVAEYVRECHRRGIVELRIVHGKGTGAACDGRCTLRSAGCLN
jgi:DNA-nicking Smr family endonuclease